MLFEKSLARSGNLSSTSYSESFVRFASENPCWRRLIQMQHGAEVMMHTDSLGSSDPGNLTLDGTVWVAAGQATSVVVVTQSLILSSSASIFDRALCLITPRRGSTKMFWATACRKNRLVSDSLIPLASLICLNVASSPMGKARARSKRTIACRLMISIA